MDPVGSRDGGTAGRSSGTELYGAGSSCYCVTASDYCNKLGNCCGRGRSAPGLADNHQLSLRVAMYRPDTAVKLQAPKEGHLFIRL